MGPHKQDVGTWMTVASADKECQTDPLEASGADVMAEALKKMAAEMAQMRAEMAQPSHARTSNQERIVFPEGLVPAPASTVADFMELADRIGRGKQRFMDAFQRNGGRSSKDSATKIMLTLADRSVLENFSRTGKVQSTKKALLENVIYLVKFTLLQNSNTSVDDVNEAIEMPSQKNNQVVEKNFHLGTRTGAMKQSHSFQHCVKV